MPSVRVKIDICEYYLEYETIDDIKNHFRKNNTPHIGLDTVDNYGGNSKGQRVSLSDLSLEHISWVNGSCEWGDRYLRGWKNK